MENSAPAPPPSRVLSAAPPTFTPADAEEISLRVFGVEGRGSELGSERDQNFRIEGADGRSFTLKVSNSGEDPSVLEMETAAILHAANVDPELPLPEPIRTTDGELQTEVEGPDSARHLVQLLTFLEGLDVDGRAVPAEAFHDIAVWVARMGRALRGFFHPAAGRELLWDVKHLSRLRPMLPHIEEGSRRELVARVIDRFEERVAPVLPSLRAQVVHGDLALGNVLIDERGHVT